VLSSAPALASKKRGAANTVTRRKSESASTNKKTVTNSNIVASVPKQPRQRRESSKDKSQTAPSLATATQRRSSMGQSRKKETLRSATENKRTTARRKVCSECDNSRKRRLFCNYSSLHGEMLCFSIPLNILCLTRVYCDKFTWCYFRGIHFFFLLHRLMWSVLKLLLICFWENMSWFLCEMALNWYEFICCCKKLSSWGVL